MILLQLIFVLVCGIVLPLALTGAALELNERLKRKKDHGGPWG